MPPALFFSLLLFQRKTALCFRKPLFLSLFFALYLVLLPLQLQGLLGFCPNPCLFCLLPCCTGSALRIVCHATGLDLYSRTEFQLIIVLQDILQNRILFRLRSKSHLADGQLPILDQFKDSYPEWIFEEYRQTPFIFFHFSDYASLFSRQPRTITIHHYGFL